MQFEEFADCIRWFRMEERQENDHAWRVPVEEVLKYNKDGVLQSVNLDIKNPNSAEVITLRRDRSIIQDFGEELSERKSKGKANQKIQQTIAADFKSLYL